LKLLKLKEKAAEIHANLRLRGLPIQTEDILIAATAIVKGLIVVSNDSDLLRVEGISLENWFLGQYSSVNTVYISEIPLNPP